MTILLALLLLQMPPTCGDGMCCSSGGFQSSAALNYGSGAPDFICGNTDDLPDGGWGPASKYCLIVTRESAGYTGFHGDLTVMASRPRSAGWLFFLGNSYFGSGFPVFNVKWNGDVWSWGSYEASGNGGGLRNLASYAVVSGNSQTPTTVPDVIAAHRPRAMVGWGFGTFNGSGFSFRVRDDGALDVAGQVLRVETNSDALRLIQELADGGTRQATLRWDP